MFFIRLALGQSAPYCEKDQALPRQVGGNEGETIVSAWDMALDSHGEEPEMVVTAFYSESVDIVRNSTRTDGQDESYIKDFEEGFSVV